MQSIPFNEDMEKAIIVAVLSDPTLMPTVSSVISPDDFFKGVHKEIFSVISSMEIDRIDSIAVSDKLSSGTQEYLRELIRDSDQILPSLTNILFYAEQIRGDSRLRNGIDLGREIIAICMEPNIPPTTALQRLEDKFSQFVQQRIAVDPLEVPTVEAFDSFVESLGKRVRDDNIIRTGFYSMDMILHKLDGLIILAARPSLGKTALAINISRHVSESHPVLFFSLEQTREQIFERMLATESQVNLEEITTGAFMGDEDSISRIRAARKALVPIMENLHIDDTSGVSAAYITSVSRKKHIEHGSIGLIVVDYLHLMSVDNSQSKTDALGEAVKALRNLGKELGCPVILLSQLNRQGENAGTGSQRARRPELSDLRGSGDIEQSADVVMFLYRDSYYDDHGYVPEEDIVEVLIRKHRNGRTGFTTLKWMPKFVKFGDL